MKSPLVDQVTAQLTVLSDLAGQVARVDAGRIADLAQVVLDTFEGGGKVMFCGNGGSAADAQHLATEYVVRFRREGRALPALALTTDTSLLTASANDHGFEHVFARQVEALGRPGDLLVLHSTSGESENLLRVADTAAKIGVHTVALLARGGGRLKDRVDHVLVLPTETGARAQELQLAIGHVICDIVEERLRTGEDG